MLEIIVDILLEYSVGSLGAFVLWVLFGCKGSYMDVYPDNKAASILLGIVSLALCFYFLF